VAEEIAGFDDASPSKGRGASRPDLASLAGLVVAFAGILGGLLIEGGRIKDVGQFTAALIVLGGTAGAVMVSTPLRTLINAVGRLKGVVLDSSPELGGVIDEVIGFATQARKQGLVSLEQSAERTADPFLRKALSLAVDGADIQEIRGILQLEIELEERRAEADARVFESAGGYAPTIGIIGAVLGLIQVMQHLANIDEVGRGIAVSFVATVYGVGSANLFFLPAASKIKARADGQIQRKELILEGVLGIAEGLNPKLIRSKLEAYTGGQAKVKSQNVKKRARDAEAA
jgi:chemotaxis protein MotA